MHIFKLHPERSNIINQDGRTRYQAIFQCVYTKLVFTLEIDE